MADIIYFTNAQDNENFENYLSLWKDAPNLSNQNFHNKLIRALSITHHIEVISIRPINSNFKQKSLSGASKIEENITWNYPLVKTNRVDKLLNTSKRVKRILSKKINKDTTIFVDALNRTLLKQSIKLKNKYHLRTIGVCTDNPNNISFISDKYKNELMRLTESLDGYVTLTPKLNELFNKNNKPYVIIDGLTEEINCQTINITDKPYIFFGGSLMRKYGVYNLIEAFRKINNKGLNLLICGHHQKKEFNDYIKNDENIIYLGALPYQKTNAIQKGALVAINPRPIDPQIDEYSVPSKTLEYMANEILTITVDNPLLKNRYKNAIIWSKSGEIDDLYMAMMKALQMNKDEKDKMINEAKSLVKQFTSLEIINKQIDKLLF